MNKVSLIISSRLENVRLAALCSREIAGHVFNDEALAEIELAVVELVNNCVEHACEGSDESQISIEFELVEDSLIIQVSDPGKPFDPQDLKNINTAFDFDAEDFENLPEGGMGLKIVHNCMDTVSYQSLDNINHWRLVKYRPMD